MNSEAPWRVKHLLTACIFIAGVVSTGQSAWGATLWSTSNGTDSPTCGAQTKPCRSISQAIENASGGDTIYVGAGHYGDLGGDGTFSAPGSEHPQR